MTKNELMELAAQAGIAVPAYRDHIELLTKFAELIAAKEREACAKIAQETVCDTHIQTGIKIRGGRAAKAIRARGNT